MQQESGPPIRPTLPLRLGDTPPHHPVRPLSTERRPVLSKKKSKKKKKQKTQKKKKKNKNENEKKKTTKNKTKKQNNKKKIKQNITLRNEASTRSCADK